MNSVDYDLNERNSFADSPSHNSGLSCLDLELGSPASGDAALFAGESLEDDYFGNGNRLADNASPRLKTSDGSEKNFSATAEQNFSSCSRVTLPCPNSAAMLPPGNKKEVLYFNNPKHPPLVDNHVTYVYEDDPLLYKRIKKKI